MVATFIHDSIAASRETSLSVLLTRTSDFSVMLHRLSPVLPENPWSGGAASAPLRMVAEQVWMRLFLLSTCLHQPLLARAARVTSRLAWVKPSLKTTAMAAFSTSDGTR
jgi:hypothetical protein